MEIDVSRACRTCLCESNDMYQIRESAMNHNDSNFDWKNLDLSIAEVIMACSVVNITPDDGLPQSVCSQCLHQVQQAFSYKRMCEQSDEKLRQYLLDGSSSIKAELSADMKTEQEFETFFEPETIEVDDFHMDDDVSDPDFEPAAESDAQSGGEEKEKIKSVHRVKIIETKDIDETEIMEQAQVIDGRYQCTFCDKSLADRQTYRLHIRLHIGKNLKRCKFCDRGFAKQNHLDRHLATHSKTYKCKFCTRTFLTVDEQKEHSASCTKSNGEKAKEDVKLEKKREARSSGKIPKAKNSEDDNKDSDYNPENDERSADEKEDTNHSKESQKIRNIPFDEEELRLLNSAKQVDGRYECPLCSRTLAQRKILKLHIRAHVGRNLLRCRVCNRGFAKGSNLNRHMLLHESEKNKEEERILSEAQQPNGSYCCQFCMKVILHRQSFRFHLRLHTGNELKHCEICNQSFAEDEELQKHMSVHGDHFPCGKCDEVFKTFRDRREHINAVHSPRPEEKPEPSKIHKKPATQKEADDADDDDEKYDDEDEQLVKSAEFINGRYQCKLCDKTLGSRTTLKLHIRLHIGKKLKKCSTCGHGFSKKSHLDRHLKTHLKEKRECNFCHAMFETYQERKAHMVAVHKDVNPMQQTKTAIISWTQANGRKTCECMICDATFERISQLREHLDWHASTTDWIHGTDLKSKFEQFQTFSEFKYGEFTNDDIGQVVHAKLKDKSWELLKMYRITNECGWELSLTDSETEDENDEQKRNYDCGKCDQTFDRLHKLMCHMKGDHSNVSNMDFKEFQCGYCLQCYPNATILAKHLRQQCGNQAKSIHCSMCYNRFTWQRSLDHHFAIYHSNESKVLGPHIQPRSFSCEQCSKSFYREDQLDAHRQRHLPQEKRFSCDICQKRFSRFDNMRSHMRIHVPPEEREAVVNKHLCSYCGRSFSNSSNLVVHIRRHTGEKPYACEVCNARFPRSSDLQCHRRTHTGEKPCLCLVCGKRFSRSNKLVRHMRIHTGEKPYKCGQCDRAFTQSNDLTLHIRRHTGDKPFVCDCGERFITNSLLQQHRRAQGHIVDSMGAQRPLPSNHVNNPHRKFTENDGKRTGITMNLSNALASGEYSGGGNTNEDIEMKPMMIQNGSYTQPTTSSYNYMG